MRYIEREKLYKQRLAEAVRIMQVNWLFKRGKCSEYYRHNQIKKSVKVLRNLKRQLSKCEVDVTIEESIDDLLGKNTALHQKVDRLSNLMKELIELEKQNLQIEKAKLKSKKESIAKKNKKKIDLPLTVQTDKVPTTSLLHQALMKESQRKEKE